MSNDETGFVQTMVGFFTMISSAGFKKALSDESHEAHEYAIRVKDYIDKSVDEIHGFLEEGMAKLGQSKFAINPKQMLAEAMLRMGGK